MGLRISHTSVVSLTDLRTCLIFAGILLSAGTTITVGTPGFAEEWPRYIEPHPETGSCAAVIIEGGALLHTGQVTPPAPSNEFDAPFTPEEQVQLALAELQETLQFGHSDLSRVIKLNVYVSHPSMTPLVHQFLAARYAGTHKPAVSYVTTPLPTESHMVAFDAVALTSRPPMATVERFAGRVKGGPGSAAVLPAGPRVYISAQSQFGDGTLAGATRATMTGLLETLAAIGLSPRDVVQLKAFLAPVDESGIAITEMASFFPGTVPPPVALVEWDSPYPIQIELIAAARPPVGAARDVDYFTDPNQPQGADQTEVILAAKVVQLNSLRSVYLGSSFGLPESSPEQSQPEESLTTDSPIEGDVQTTTETTIAPSADSLPEVVQGVTPIAASETTHDDAESNHDEVREVFATLRRIAEAAGSDLNHLVKATYYVTDEELEARFEAERQQVYDPSSAPAASQARVIGVGSQHRSVSLDVIAAWH